MSTPAVLAALWALAATIVALLPMHRQYPPGFALLLSAPLLIVWLGYEYGALAGAAAAFAFVSMFRNPLRFLLGKVKERLGFGPGWNPARDRRAREAAEAAGEAGEVARGAGGGEDAP